MQLLVVEAALQTSGQSSTAAGSSAGGVQAQEHVAEDAAGGRQQLAVGRHLIILTAVESASGKLIGLHCPRACRDDRAAHLNNQDDIAQSNKLVRLAS